MSDMFAGWRKSSYSGDGNSCIELGAARPGASHVSPTIGVRDSKRDGRGPVLQFSPSAWREFLSRVKSS
jgi:hypothetical protein